jgi:hypothetical protein
MHPLKHAAIRKHDNEITAPAHFIDNAEVDMRIWFS